MTIEGGPNFNSEVLSRSFVLAEKFKRNGVLGEKTDRNERDNADEKAREILDTSFVVKNAEGQINNVEYTSVEHMIRISKDPALTDDARERTKQALYEIGLALSQDKDVFKAATEGEAELKKVLPPSLHEIQPYLLSSYLTSGKGDTEGQELVEEMIDVFKLKRKADRDSRHVHDYEEKAKDLSGKLMDICDEASAEDVKSGKVDRMEAMMGFVIGIDDKTGRRPVLTGDEEKTGTKPKTLPFRPRYGEDGDKTGGVEAAWQVTPEKLAEAMLFMDSSVRWQSYTPPEWFKALPEEEQARIEYMVMVCEGASNMIYAGKDLEKILGNKMYFAFDNEKFTKLFNGDFKLVMSKMLNDLCEIYTDERTGNKCLRYKEKFYKIGKDGRFIEDSNGNRIVTNENDPDSRADIDQDVIRKLEGIRNYKNDLAKFLAKQAGRSEVSYMDQMNAYTAWNLFFMFGDSSIADRMRLLPTYNGIICDPVRTLNMGAKAENKLKISKGQREVGDEELFEAEIFGGQIARQVRKVMMMERDLGVAVDKKTGRKLRQKIISGEFPLFEHKMAYGFLDFIAGGRDLYRGDGLDDKGEIKWKKIDASEGETLATLFMNYASFDDKGDLIAHKDVNSFSLGNNQVDFLNWWRDHMEMAGLANQTMMGKAEVKTVEQFAGTINDKIGMLRGVRINGRRLSYSTDPGFWANIIWGSLPIDTTMISSDFIKLKQEANKDGSTGAYSSYVDRLLREKMGFSDTDVSVNEIARYLGVEIVDGMRADGMITMIGNDLKNAFTGFRSGRLERQQSNLANNAANNSEAFNGIVSRFNRIDKTTLSGTRLVTYKSLEMAIKAKNFTLARQLIDRI